MNPQQVISYDGHEYVVETRTTRHVTKLGKDHDGLVVADGEATEVLEVADRLVVDRAGSLWAQTELSETLIAQFEMALETQADPFVRAALAFAVQTFVSDVELAEWLARMIAGELAA